MFTSVKSRVAAYQRTAQEINIQGADNHQLVSLLFEGLMQSLLRARGAIERQDVATKGEALGKSVRILEEGLKASLNLDEGGSLATNLLGLYDYSILRLTHANLKSDRSAVDEVINLIEPIAQAWRQIRGSRGV